MSIPAWFYGGMIVGVICLVYPVIFVAILFGSAGLYFLGNWNGFWKRFESPAIFRKPTQNEYVEVQTALAFIEGVSPSKYKNVIDESHVGVAEYRGKNGSVKVYAVAVHGHDEMQLFLKENERGTLELSGWGAPKMEKK